MHAGISATPRVLEARKRGHCLQDGTWGPGIEISVSFSIRHEQIFETGTLVKRSSNKGSKTYQRTGAREAGGDHDGSSTSDHHQI